MNIIEYIVQNGYYNTLEKLAAGFPLRTPRKPTANLLSPAAVSAQDAPSRPQPKPVSLGLLGDPTSSNVSSKIPAPKPGASAYGEGPK